MKIRRRRRWFELNESAKAYNDKFVKKWENAGRPSWILKLPRGFTCWHYSKKVSLHDRFHLALIIALASPKGQLEYDMLEIEHGLLRKVPRSK